MVKTRVFSIIVAIAMLVCSFAACSGAPADAAQEPAHADAAAEAKTETAQEPAEVQKGGTLVVLAPSSPKTVDPRDHTTDYEADIIVQVAQTLITYNKDYTDVIPLLATEWTISEDGKEYDFKLRDDVYFQKGKYQDGRQMVADDVKYSLERIKNECPAADRLCVPYFDYVEVVNDFEVILHLTDSCGPFLEALCNAGNVIIPKEEVEGWGDEFGYHLIGTGPFVLGEMIPDEKTTLVRNENYWGEPANVDAVEIRVASDNSQIVNALLTNEGHIGMQLQGESIGRALDAGILVQSPASSVTQIRFNMQNGPTANPLVREAIIRAIDIDELVAGIYQYGEAVRIYQPLTFLSWAYTDEFDSMVPSYDPAEAKKLLAEAGYADGLDLNLYIPSSTNRDKMAQIVQYYLEEVGIHVTIKASAIADWMGTVTNSWKEDQVNMYGITFNGNLDPYEYENKFFSDANNGAVNNAGGYHNDEVEVLLGKGYNGSDRAKRAEYYQQAMKQIMSDNTGIYYSCESRNWGVTSKVHEAVVRADNRLLICTPFNNIWIEK